MSILFDLILLAILGLCAFIGYKLGLIRTLKKFICYIISFTIANKLYVLLAKLFVKMSFLEKLLAGEPFAESMTALDRIQYSFDQIKENIVIFDKPEVVEAAAAIRNHNVAILISSALAFVLTFIIATVLVKLLLMLCNNLIAKIPVVKQANGILGAIFGLLNGFFWTWTILNIVVKFFLSTLAENWPSAFVEGLTNSWIVHFCTTINPVTYLISLINFIFH